MNASCGKNNQTQQNNNEHKNEPSSSQIKIKETAKQDYMHWFTLKLKDQQMEQRFQNQYQQFENNILYILLLFIGLLYLEEYIENPSLFYIIAGSLVLAICLIVICFIPKRPIIIFLLRSLYLIVLAIYLYNQYSLQSNVNFDGHHKSKEDQNNHNYNQFQKIYNFQFLVLMSSFIFYNSWFISAAILQISNISVYIYFFNKFFSITQIIAFFYPLLFYFILRREKKFYATTYVELINLIEQIIPMGLIIIKKNNPSKKESSVFCKILSLFKSKEQSTEGNQSQIKIQNESKLKKCCLNLHSVFCYPFRCLKNIKKKDKNTQQLFQIQQQISSPQPLNSQIKTNCTKNKKNETQKDETLLKNLRKQPQSSSNSTYSSSTPSLLNSHEFKVSYCNQFFLDNFAVTNASPHSPEHRFSHSQRNIQAQSQNANKVLSKYKTNQYTINKSEILQNEQQLYHIISKSLKRMNLIKDPIFVQSSNDHKNYNNINNYLTNNPISSQRAINLNKDDKQFTSILKIPSQNQQETPKINKLNLNNQIAFSNYNMNHTTSQNQNSPLKEENHQNLLFSNANLHQKSLLSQPDNKLFQNSNHTVQSSSKNILSPEDPDSNRPLYSFQHILAQNKQLLNINSKSSSFHISNLNNNIVKSKFININPPQTSNEGQNDDLSDPTTNRHILAQTEQIQTNELEKQNQQIQKNPSILALDETYKLEEKNRNLNLQTIFDYVKQRICNPQKLTQLKDQDIDEEKEDTTEAVNCYQIDDKSDMKKRIYVQFADGIWQGENVLFLLINKNSHNEKMLEDKLQEVETFKYSLLKTVSHDLKTPLNGMTIILEDMIQYFKTKQKSLHQKLQRQNNTNNNNIHQSLALIQLSPQEHQMVSYGSSQNIPPVNGIQHLVPAYKTGVSELFGQNSLMINNHQNFNNLNNNGGKTNYKEKKQQVIRHIENLNQILFSTKILTSVIDDILDYSAIKINNFRLNSDYFDLRQLLLEIKDLFQKTFEQKKLQFQLDFSQFQDQSSISIYNDQKRIKQVLINMVCNSLKYTPKGFCKVVIQKSEVNQDVLIVSVKDSGEGMDENTKHKLFQLYENTDSDIHGVGLGLVICRNIIGFLGPSENIDVESELGKGSTFSFQIYLKNQFEMNSKAKNEKQQFSEALSARDIQQQKNNLQVSGINLLYNRVKESSHSLAGQNAQPFNANKSLFLQSPTFKKHKKANLRNSIQSFDQLPKRIFIQKNLQVKNIVKNEQQEKDIILTQNKINQQDSPLEIIDDIPNTNREHVVSIVLNEEKPAQNNISNNIKFNNQNILTISQNIIQAPSERSIKIYNHEFNKQQGTSNSNNPKQLISNDLNEFNSSRILQLFQESNQKQLFQQIRQHINNQSSQIDSINYEETPQSKFDKQNQNNPLNGFQEIMNRENLVFSPEQTNELEDNQIHELNGFKQQECSQIYESNSINIQNCNNIPNSVSNNTKNNITNLGDSHAEYLSIEQEQYVIPEFDHNTNNLREHFMQIPNKRILIVDDNFFNQCVLESLLKNIHGIELIDKAENGQIAIQKIQDLNLQYGFTYDLILMDWQMPILDGLQATIVIRQLEFLQEHPPYIIFVTASSAQEKNKIVTAGANAFIEKPVNPQIFYEEYQKFLDFEYSNMIKSQPNFQ
ncbi:hypothetical protein ABPG74_013672 [Tetrahymena malaccensis]